MAFLRTALLRNNTNLKEIEFNFNCGRRLLQSLSSQSAANGTGVVVPASDKLLDVERSKQGRRSVSASSAAPTTGKDPLDITFEDAKAAFKSKTNMELLRGYVVYQLCSIEYLVDNNKMLMKWMKTLIGERAFVALMKATFYGHFVAGEDQYKIIPVLERLRSFGVKPILDYSAEEDISEEEAAEREVKSSMPEPGGPPKEVDPNIDSMKQFQVDKKFADRRYKVQSARTYFYLNEATCERNMETFLKCLEAVAGSTYGTGITAVKLTALGRPQLLLQLSEVIARARNYVNQMLGGDGNVLSHHMTRSELEKRIADAKFTDQAAVKQFLDRVTSDAKGILHIFPWSGIVDENQELSNTFRVPDLKSGKMVRLITQLSKNEEDMFRNMVRRMNTLVKAAQDMDVRLMVDAEHTYFQPAISRLTLEFMRKYNTEKAIVYNTYQCYLKSAFKEVQTDLEQSKRQNFYFGAKLVRGAYIEQERARAAVMGYPDPTCESFDATSKMFHDTLTECLRRIKDLKNAGLDQKRIGIMVASHNEDTVRFAIQKMKEIGVEPQDKVICFGQLLAMCDYITFPLGQSGYSAYKYIPYGPVNEVLPYLSRRAQENKGVLKKIQKEKRLLSREILRRMVTGQLWYTPKGNYVPV